MYLNKNWFFPLLIILLLPAFSLFSQTKNTRKADNLFRNNEYSDAIEEYKDILKNNNNRTEKAYINFQVGECYRLINDAAKAESWYNKAVNSKYDDKVAMLYLAQMKLKNQKYEEADTTFRNYQKSMPEDKRAKIGIESCSQAVAWTSKPTRYIVENMTAINTKESEFSPVYG